MNFSVVMLRLSLASGFGAVLVFLLHTTMFNALTPLGEFSVAGLVWCSGLTLFLSFIARALAQRPKK